MTRRFDRLQKVRALAGVVTWRFMRRGPNAALRLLRDRQSLLASSSFDPDYYARRYPDVAVAGVDPAIHYLLHGLDEGRSPNLSAERTPPAADRRADPSPPQPKAPPELVNSFNVVAVHGEPNAGKSTLRRALIGVPGLQVIDSDAIFLFKIVPQLPNAHDYWTYAQREEGEFNIAAYVLSSELDLGLFTSILEEDIRDPIRRFPHTDTILMEGYVFKHHEEIFRRLRLPPERTMVLVAEKVGEEYLVGGMNVTAGSYDSVVEHVRTTMRAQCIATTVPKSTYQSFEHFGFGASSTDSESTAKYRASHLDEVTNANDRVADLGCNAGLFCFRLAERTQGDVVGVDVVRSWLEIASHINASIFRHTHMTFVAQDIVEFVESNHAAFDVLHCASTYHYLRERQASFLKGARGALKQGGRLVLEVELAPGDGAAKIEARARSPREVPVYFPNRAMFLEQIDALFEIEADYPSVSQRGSPFERRYFHLSPI